MRFFRFHGATLILGVILLALMVASPVLQQTGYAQSTNTSGAIQGTITDPKGAILPGATISITSLATGAKKDLISDSAGFYSVSSLVPGQYQVAVAAPGFAKTTTTFTVQIGVTSNGNLTLRLGATTEEVVVSSEALQVNTVQSTVDGVLTETQIDNLPISGRNFLDLSQLEPGVQLQDGQGFDPTKGGYSSVSFNGVNGRTARIMLDGQDISDETVGTTTLNVSSGSIEEFQLSRSSLDISNELTSSGAVTVSTRSGTNSIHGQAFGLLRDQAAGDALQVGGSDYYFQREQFGIRAGGPLLKNKLFFFGDSERVKQDSFVPYQVPSPFQGLSGGWGSPYRDTYSVGRLDYNAPKGIHVFFRGAYENNLSASNFGLGYARYGNKDNTPIWAGGADFITGKITHSVRASYLKFHNLIVDESAGLPDPVKGIYLTIHGFRTGPSPDAPQQTFQSDKQFRYDGGLTVRSHVIGFGVSLNRILGGGLAAFFNYGPEVSGSGAFSQGPIGTGGSGLATDPSAYLASAVYIGNGEGFDTERPGFGFPAGGQGDWRVGIYAGDTWKVLPRLTINYGVRYSRDTGRIDGDLAPTPCSDAVASFGPFSPCTTGNLLDALVPGLGARTQQPNADFGPKAGFAYDLKGNGRTVIRGGLGLYFENSVFNNVLFDRAGRLPKGLFFGDELLTPSTTAVPMPDGSSLSSIKCPDGTTQSVSSLWKDAISVSGPCFAAIQQQYQKITAAVGASSNGGYIANNLSTNTGNFIYAPDYKTARSVQINIGVQREVWKGGILSADYIRNVGLHFMQQRDANHVGDARYLNLDAADNAIAGTLASCQASSIDQAIQACKNPAHQSPANPLVYSGAAIADFAGNGLDSGNALLSSYPAGAFGLKPSQGAAFAGMNPGFGQMEIVYPMGRSVYNGLQVSLRQGTRIPVRGMKGSNFEISYALSRFLSSAGGAGASDQNFTPGSWDNNNPLSYMGYAGLDRRHQLSYGGNLTWAGGITTSLIGHYYSALPTALYLDSGGNTTGEIFQSDITGDGTTQDLLPGVRAGAFMRTVTPGNIATVIANYNATAAGRFTPAGQALVSNGLFTANQLVSLGAVTRSIAAPVANNAGNGSLKTFDFVLGRPLKVAKLGEKFSFDPTVSFFNLFNFANYGEVTGNLNSAVQSGSANGTDGSYDSSDPYNRNALRAGNGSGIFGQGTSRVIEYGLKINF
jgi:hypothetical protein